jgi:hypothetical protein
MLAHSDLLFMLRAFRERAFLKPHFLPRARLFHVVFQLNRVYCTSKPRSFPVLLLPHLGVPRICAFNSEIDELSCARDGANVVQTRRLIWSVDRLLDVCARVGALRLGWPCYIARC